MDEDIIYVLSSLVGIAICCFCSVFITRCLYVCNNKNIEKEVIEPVRIEIIHQPNYQITKTYLPQDATITSMAGTK
jgi:hypothetical protein